MISSLIFIYAQNEVTIKFNNVKVGFPDAKPYMDTQVGRVLVPVRFGLENLGADVDWYIYNDNYSRYIQVGHINTTIHKTFLQVDNKK